jgi:hypothetical protein
MHNRMEFPMTNATYPTFAQRQRLIEEAHRQRSAVVAGLLVSLWRSLSGLADRLSSGPTALAR